MADYQERLASLKRYLKINDYAAIILPMGDPHGSEYIGECDRWIFYLTGFSGSAATLVVYAADDPYLIVDGRYHIQAENELAGTGIRLIKLGCDEAPTRQDALMLALAHIKDGRVALPYDLISHKGFEAYERLISEMAADLQPADIDLNDMGRGIWPDRPARRASAGWLLPESVTGSSLESRIRDLRRKTGAYGAEFYIVTALDTIGWIFDLRGDDIAYTPVLYAWFILGQDSGCLYLQKKTADSLSSEFTDRLKDLGITVGAYEDFERDVTRLSGHTALDAEAVNHRIVCSLNCSVVSVINSDITQQTCKNDIQLNMIKKAHLLDGLALTRLIYRIKQGEFTGRSEWDVACALEEIRREFVTYIEPSFETIAACGENAAIVHYTPDRKRAASLEDRGFLLLDAGGQYTQGTTDVTRTIALGPLSEEEKIYYTAVLQGHLRLANAVIDTKTATRMLDRIAREPLWDLGADYLHGTGHGVGHVLSVHEGPVKIARAAREDYTRDVNGRYVRTDGNERSLVGDRPLRLGEVVSDEPGYYREGAFGVRIENLIVRRRNLQLRPYLETLTVVPYEPEAILTDKLSAEEKRWLNRYHGHVYEALSPHLSEEERDWLKSQTKPV